MGVRAAVLFSAAYQQEVRTAKSLCLASSLQTTVKEGRILNCTEGDILSNLELLLIPSKASFTWRHPLKILQFDTSFLLMDLMGTATLVV